MIKVVIMDADGVLINGERFSDVLSREFDVDPVKEKQFFTTVFQDCLTGKEDLRVSVRPYLKSFGWDGSADELLEFWFKSEHSLNEELMNLVGKLRRAGITVVLATNQEKYRTGYMLKNMGFEGKFDAIYSSAHVGYKKPDDRFYQHILSDQNIAAEEAIFWDDDEKNIQGARASGIRSDLYQDIEHFRSVMNLVLPNLHI